MIKPTIPKRCLWDGVCKKNKNFVNLEDYYIPVPTNTPTTGDVLTVDANGNYVWDEIVNIIRLYYEAGDDTIEITVDAAIAKTYNTATSVNSGAIGGAVFEINNVVTTLPFTLNIGDTLKVTRADDTLDGYIEFS